ncbi:MAG TPA: GGDEF domain-containing protein, partial [Gammaproteobacteria bacterium]|nr:GGDEF domain-containing protein [Gammaproteobacteria bacterium]
IIIGSDGIPEGIITERDLVCVMEKMLEAPDIVNQPAAEFMSPQPHTIQYDQSLFDALAITRAEKIRHLPVVDAQQKLVGLLTQTDLTRAYFHIIELQRNAIEKAIENRTEELRNANRELESLCMEDALLGIGNRRAMEADMAHTHSLALRYQRPYCVALLDVDFFKRYNDHYGHLAGDKALQQVTAVVKQTIRKSDRVYRYGGEEFLLLLPDTTAEGGGILIGRLLEALQQSATPHCKSPYGVLTMSAGLIDLQHDAVEDAPQWEDIVHHADQALYRAKNMGRNRVA